MAPKLQQRLLFRFGLRTMLVFVTLIGVCLTIIARPVYERKRMMRWIENNGGSAERWYKPEPIVINSGPLTIVSTSYQRILGPEKESEIPRWREWLGDVPVNIITLPVGSEESEINRARLLFPEAEVNEAVKASAYGGVF